VKPDAHTDRIRVQGPSEACDSARMSAGGSKPRVKDLYAVICEQFSCDDNKMVDGITMIADQLVVGVRL
jgi:hypothetical protein